MTETPEPTAGLGLGQTARPKPGSGPKPKGQGRVTLSPPLRRAVADVHARQTWKEHLAAHHPAANLEQLADLLTVREVPPVRGRGPWSPMRVHHLMQRARRAARAGA